MVLFDANVLIALGDMEHAHRSAARAALEAPFAEGRATCALTENAFLRVVGRQSYPKRPGSPHRAQLLLQKITSLRGHQFWPEDVSLLARLGEFCRAPRLTEPHGFLSARAGGEAGRAFVDIGSEDRSNEFAGRVGGI